MSLGEEMRTWKPSTVLTFWGMVVGTWAGVSLTLGVRVWSWATGTPAPGNPIDLVGAIARGRLVATTGMWVCVGVAGALVLAVVLLPRLARAGGGRRERGDDAARRTGRRRDTRGINEKSVRAKAKRLVKTDIDAFGLPIGKAVNDRRSLWSSFEDVCTVIAGPRAGKTTCWVVSRILWAPGLVVATSNKRDVLDETRQARGRRGNVWVFDPQSIALEPQVFWWDILSYITDAPKDLAETKALALSQIFIDTTRDSRAQTNAYFDQASKNLVAALLLARRLPRRALVLAAAMAGSAGLTVVLKLVFARHRPPVDLLADEALSTYSFPSGHSFNTAVFAGALAGFVLFSPASGRRKAVAASGAVAAATAVGLSRVYLAYHWFTDVLAGWALAAAWLCLVALVVRRPPVGRCRVRR